MNLSSLSLLLFAALTAIVLALLLVTATLGRLLFGRGSRRRIETPPLLIRRHGTTGRR